jgi:hypothetical protein
MADFSVPLGTEPAYDGTMQATVFELAAPDTPVPTNHIRTTQNWGVRVDWEMTGAFTPFLIDEFRLRAFVESIGPGAEMALPLAGPVIVNTLAGPLGVGPKRTYSANINIPAGTVPAGVYKLVTLVQLHDDGAPGNPYPVVATVEGPIVTIFQPA